ncbi:MAG: Gfo/Idh/MocA family oxidoreductase [Solobacterium sp.]|jgi:predicted dehydrogenase|nr:Gfo/Idh/MocA family oxidoreductase [Solobacterium sp.]MCH4205970.1 Gfo/Idh/MocA family oxidoreductase [Solobacterium sp.]MCH4227422.1 Gfo/Idh/MocA family oxidoreductase [Solobacterium sp.]MCH4282791.1 Gfo/Idh/MocA family oxidoreductase [Solobacterium sp.]
MIQWGIVGAGNIAKRFANSLQYETNACLYAISGRNAEKMKAFQKEHPCEKIYLSHEELLNDPKIDAVYIALPHDMHAEWSIKALQKKKAVLCEKPAAINEAEVQNMTDTAEMDHTLFMEAMKSRFEPAYIRTGELIKDGTIGEILTIKAQIASVFPKEKYASSYLTKPGVGGALLDTGCYCINWLNAYFKGEPEIEILDAVMHDAVEYYADAKLYFKNGTGEILAGFDRRLEPLAEIVGTKGKIIVEKPHRPDKIHLFLNGSETIIDLPYLHDDFYGQIHHFDTLLQEGRTESDVMSYADSIRNAHLLDAVKKKLCR